MKAVFQRLLKDSMIYGFGSLASKSVTFFALPVYTRLLLPAEYGYLESLLIMGNLLAAFIIMGMDSALSMFYYKHKSDGVSIQSEIISAVLQWRILSSIVLVLIVVLCSAAINEKVFSMGLTPLTISIAFIGTFFTQILSQCAEVMRLMFRPYQYLSIMLGQSVGSALLSILFIYKFEMGLLGYFMGVSLAGIVISLFGLYSLRAFLNFSRLYIEWWMALLKFGLPLLPAGLSIYFMSTADRWFILHYHGPEMLGYFAVAAKFSMVITLIVEAFRTAWWPHAMDCLHDEKLHGIFDRISGAYISVGVLIIILLTLISSSLVGFVAGEKYSVSSSIVGILAWQPFFYGYYLICSIGIWKSEKTYLSLIIATLAAVLGIVLNFILVPKYGLNGAAMATAITYFLWIVVTFRVSDRLLDLNIDKAIFFTLVIVGFFSVCLISFPLIGNHKSIDLIIVLIANILAYLYVFLRLKILNVKRINEGNNY